MKKPGLRKGRHGAVGIVKSHWGKDVMDGMRITIDHGGACHMWRGSHVEGVTCGDVTCGVCVTEVSRVFGVWSHCVKRLTLHHH